MMSLLVNTQPNREEGLTLLSLSGHFDPSFSKFWSKES